MKLAVDMWLGTCSEVDMSFVTSWPYLFLDLIQCAVTKLIT